MVENSTEHAWQQYQEQGYWRLGKVIGKEELAALQQRIDDIMLGKADVDYDRMLMQRDSESGRYGDLGHQTKGFKGATINYRKIEHLEYDPIFLRYMQQPLFREICAQVYGPETSVACFRAMFMNKPTHSGTFLPWHQDRWSNLDRDPRITLWAALDLATVANGCLQVIPGSHTKLVNPEHGAAFLNEQQRAELDDSKAIHLELEAGEAVLLHNWLLHRSDVNNTDSARRAFSICYMDARTVSKTGEKFSLIFGPGALDPEELEAVK